jgi:hypothetical protein
MQRFAKKRFPIENGSAHPTSRGRATGVFPGAFNWQLVPPYASQRVPQVPPPSAPIDYAQNYAHPTHRHVAALHDGRTPSSPQVLFMEQHIQIRLNHYAHV